MTNVVLAFSEAGAVSGFWERGDVAGKGQEYVPKGNPGKWKHGPTPAVFGWFNSDPHPWGWFLGRERGGF